MATIVITLTDTLKGSVSVQTDFIPTVGASCTPAQSTALEIITRTKRQWGLQDAAPAMHIGEQKHV